MRYSLHFEGFSNYCVSGTVGLRAWQRRWSFGLNQLSRLRSGFGEASLPVFGPHRNAEVVLGFDRDKANRFACNLKALMPQAASEISGQPRIRSFGWVRNLQVAEKNERKRQEVSGHDFSRAANSRK